MNAPLGAEVGRSFTTGC